VRRALIAVVIVVIAIAVAASFLVVGGIITTTRRIHGQGAIKAVGVEVYKDPALTVPLTEINWGTVEPGKEKNHTVYFKNESNVPITLFLSTDNWSPANASNFIALTWDYAGQLLEVDGALQVTLTLAVDPAISGIVDFSFDILVAGSG
jgi:hypothetical protein